jgi:hypothetical protein
MNIWDRVGLVGFIPLLIPAAAICVFLLVVARKVGVVCVCSKSCTQTREGSVRELK